MKTVSQLARTVAIMLLAGGAFVVGDARGQEFVFQGNEAQSGQIDSPFAPPAPAVVLPESMQMPGSVVAPQSADISSLPATSAQLPPPPEDMSSFERMIQGITERIEEQPAEEVASEPAAVDISGESIREKVRRQYDEEFEAGFGDDGWKDVENKWTHKPSGRVIMDSVNWTGDSQFPGGLANYFEMRQLRLGMSGKGYGQFEYKLEVDFEPEFRDTSGGTTVGTFGTVAMKDAFVGLRDVPLFGNIRIGHQKVNFSLAQIMARVNLTFAERTPMADPPGFTPGREVGISSLINSPSLNQSLGYGIYIDNISEAAKDRQDDNQGFLLGGRHTFLPYYDEPSNGRYLVHFGSGGIYRQARDNAVRFRARPELHEGPQFVDTGAIMANDYTVMGAELAVQGGPLTLQSEFMYTNVDEIGVGNRQLWSCYVEGAYRLTGEHRDYKREVGIFDKLVPYENFWLLPGSQGIGAWEVAARYSYVDLGDSPVDSELDVLNFALNWYWNPSIRLQANYIHPTTRGGLVGNTDTDAILLRMAVFF